MSRLSFANATRITDKHDTLYCEFLKHLEQSTSDEYTIATTNYDNYLTPSMSTYGKRFVSVDHVPLFVATHQPSSDEFIKSISIDVFIEQVTHNRDSATAPHNWIYYLIDTIDVNLNGQKILTLHGHTLEAICYNYCNGDLVDYDGAIPTIISRAHKQMSATLKIPLKNTMFDERPIFLKKGSMLTLKLKLNQFIESFFNPPHPTEASATFDVVYNISSDIPNIRYELTTQITDRALILRSDHFSFTNGAIEGAQILLQSIPIIYGNLLAIVMYCTKEVDKKQQGAISFNKFNVVVNDDNGCVVAEFDGSKRIVMTDTSRSSPKCKHKILPLYFTDFDENLKFRNINKTTFSSGIKKLTISLFTKSGTMEISNNKNTIHNIFITQIVESFVVQ